MESSNIIPINANDFQNYLETVVHGTPDFPIQIYRNNFEWYINHLLDWHWHPELELSLVLSGTMVCSFNDFQIEANAGEGFFINSNTMHKQMGELKKRIPVLITICFHPDFIEDCGSDIIFRKYIYPIISNKAIKSIKLSPDIEWQSNILKIIKEIYERSLTKEYGFELKYRNLISEIWYNIAANIDASDPIKHTDIQSAVNEKRLKQMLAFI